MENTIKKIFSDKCDEEVHSEFVKFSKGKFENRYLLDGKEQKGKWSVKSGSEFANFFVRAGLERASGEVEVKGAIISTLDLKKEIDFPINDVKMYMGIKQLLIDTKVDAKKILALMNKYPRVFFALSFSLDGYELKVKPKAPKSGKPSNKGDDGPKGDFCSLKTTDKKIVEDLFFDFQNFKEISINHTLNIEDILIPTDVKDPKEMREKAKRKGTIKRIVKVDGSEKTIEKKFTA